MTELQQLLYEKRELERKIKILTDGAVVNDIVKIDRLGCPGKYQQGKWAVYYRYKHVVNAGCHGVPKKRVKWQPLFNGDSLEEVVDMIPNAIKALTELYEQGKGEQHATDS
jgi:hypothetical protein